MGTLISFEIKKLFSQKKNILVMLLFIAFISIYIFANLHTEARSTQRLLDELDIQSRNTQTILNSYSESSDKNSAKRIYYQNKYELLKQIRFAVSQEDWRERLNLQIQLNELILQNENTYMIAELEEEIAVDRILLEKDIRPIDTDCSMLAYNFIRLSCSESIPLVLLLFIIMISADAVSCENDTGTYKVLLTQPVKRSKILFSKYISYAAVTLIFAVLVFGFAFLLLGITHGFGSAEYPIIFEDGSNMGMAGFNGLMIPLILLQILTVNAFALLCSVSTESGSGSIGAAILSIFVLYILTFLMGRLLYLTANPMIYLDAADIIKGKTIASYAQGMAVLPASALLMYFVADRIFYRKEVI